MRNSAQRRNETATDLQIKDARGGQLLLDLIQESGTSLKGTRSYLIMETIHLKTVDPISQKLLLSASQLGLELPWERFEKLQPQDGFLRLGLSCPFGCMQGPCRIDPFGRGPSKRGLRIGER